MSKTLKLLVAALLAVAPVTTATATATAVSIVKPIEPEMVRLPAGSFVMGSSSLEQGSSVDERPLHEVQVAAFALGKYEVTRAEFAAFVDATGYDTGSVCMTEENDIVKKRKGRNWQSPGFAQPSPREPVVCVSLRDAEAYIAWLNAETGKRYRLPTEAEWEYAARAGTATARYWGDGVGDACRYANVADQTAVRALRYKGDPDELFPCNDGYVYTAPVGSFAANAFGFYDLLGNVWERTCSAYTESGYNGSENKCNKHATSGRTSRGGAWYVKPQYVRAAIRVWGEPSNRLNNLGFRLAHD